MDISEAVYAQDSPTLCAVRFSQNGNPSVDGHRFHSGSTTDSLFSNHCRAAANTARSRILPVACWVSPINSAA